MKDDKLMKEAIKTILTKISDNTKIPVESLNLIGITPEQIGTALKQQTKQGISLRSAISNILKIWEKSVQTDTLATPEEMLLLGYVRHGDNWYHEQAKRTISEQGRLKYSFKTIEQYTIQGLAEQQQTPKP